YGQALLRLGKADEAANVLEKVLDKGRGSAIALVYGEALEKSGRLKDAEELFESVLRQDSENRAAAVGLLKVYERSRQFDKAIPIVEAFLKAQPGNVSLRIEYGSTLLRARRYTDATKVFQDVLKADPGNRDALRQYGTLLSETRETDKADEVFRRLQELEPEDADVPFRRALNFIDARRLPEAEKILLALKDQLAAKKRDEAEVGQVEGQLAYIAFLKKDYATAKKYASSHLMSEEGIDLQAFNLLTQIARDQEAWADGLAIARQAAAKNPKLLTVRSTLAEFLVRSSKAEDQKEGEKLLETLAGESREGTLAASDAWQRLERYSRAAATARAALETYPEDPDLLFRLAASLEREKKISESVAAFEKLLTVRQDHAAGMNYLGYLWADRGENLPRALTLIRRAVELDPGNGAYLDSLGWVYFQMNQLDKAEQNLKAAAELNPDDATIEEHLGDLYDKRGENEKARIAWRRAISLKPEDGGRKLEEKLRRAEERSAHARNK
ncbi:MAG TPA: tetratricopeptide repeat protein, partial [Thermoanaerobaculia bacterium]|nr:tetratricopeptide repeat protein [Thermoanaerobaculia bacterium]